MTSNTQNFVSVKFLKPRTRTWIFWKIADTDTGRTSCGHACSSISVLMSYLGWRHESSSWAKSIATLLNYSFDIRSDRFQWAHQTDKTSTSRSASHCYLIWITAKMSNIASEKKIFEVWEKNVAWGHLPDPLKCKLCIINSHVSVIILVFVRFLITIDVCFPCWCALIWSFDRDPWNETGRALNQLVNDRSFVALPN